MKSYLCVKNTNKIYQKEFSYDEAFVDISQLNQLSAILDSYK